MAVLNGDTHETKRGTGDSLQIVLWCAFGAFLLALFALEDTDIAALKAAVLRLFI